MYAHPLGSGVQAGGTCSRDTQATLMLRVSPRISGTTSCLLCDPGQPQLIKPDLEIYLVANMDNESVLLGHTTTIWLKLLKWLL